MAYNNRTKRDAVVKVTMPSGQKVRIVMPAGEFDLPQAHRMALENSTHGAALLKKFKLEKPKKKQDDAPLDIDDKPTDTESA